MTDADVTPAGQPGPRAGRAVRPGVPGDLDDIDLTGAVDHLGPGASGQWLVHSRTSTHLLDFDDRLYMRIPGGDAMSMPYDLRPIALLRVDRWPSVGGQMLVWTDADDAGLFEQWRLCATIKAITPTAKYESE